MSQDHDRSDEPIEALEEPGGAVASAGSVGWTGWAVSTALHVLLLLIMWGIYWVVQPPESDTPPVRVTTIDPPVERPEPRARETALEATVEVTLEAASENPSPISALELPVEVSEREAEEPSEQPKGREEAVADAELGGSGAFMAVGAGGGGAGMFGARTGGGKKRAVGRFGGTRASESAVDAALRWFKRHQGPNGQWDHVRYFANCTENPRCEPGGGAYGERADLAVTGYAVLCYLGAGYDHQTPNKYRTVVKKGIDWLIGAQSASGAFGTANYENAIVAMALAEAYAMTMDPALKGPAQRAIDICLQRQNVRDAKAGRPAEGYGDGMGWDYGGRSQRNDGSVSGWNVMALKSAMAAQLDVGTGMEGARQYLDVAWKASNPGWADLDPYTGESTFPYAYHTDTGKAEGQHLACVGAVCAVFLGRRAGDPMLETLANWIHRRQTPKAYPCNTYYLYYNTLGMFQVGGERWQHWNRTVRDMLVAAQRKGDGCFDGSWNWEGTQFHGHEVGRVLSTAYCCLTLEVYYRYAQVGEKH